MVVVVVVAVAVAVAVPEAVAVAVAAAVVVVVVVVAAAITTSSSLSSSSWTRFFWASERELPVVQALDLKHQAGLVANDTGISRTRLGYRAKLSYWNVIEINWGHLQRSWNLTEVHRVQRALVCFGGLRFGI